METTEIAGTGLRPSLIGLGTWAIGGWLWGGTERGDAIATIHAALDRGITLIDTAPVYGFGNSEEIVGTALAGSRRAKAIIATKGGLDWNEGAVFRDSRPARLDAEIEASLQRLQTDYIDIYQVHWPDPHTPIEETARALARHFERGTIRAIGVSNYSVAQMAVFRSVAPLHVVQPPLNLFERAAEDDIVPFASDSGMTVLAYGALCRGLLGGKITAGATFEGDDLRKGDPKFQQPRFAQYLLAVDRLDRFARAQFGKRVIDLAVRWILERQGSIVALWGARKPAQLDDVSGALDFRLGADALAEIDRILRETIRDPIGPDFMAPPARETA